jgi:hypothetical protein
VTFAAQEERDDEVDGGSDAEGDGGAEDDETSQSDSEGDAKERARQERQKRVDKLLALLEEPTAAAAKATKARKAATTHTKEVELAKAAKRVAAQEERDDEVDGGSDEIDDGSGKPDRDARIASDRKLLEHRRKIDLEQYAQALRERSERWEIDDIVQGSDPGVNAQRVAYLAALIENNRLYVEASDYSIREHEAIHARTKQECSTRAANGEDARDVRARWEAFERYGCCDAFEDTFFASRNG